MHAGELVFGDVLKRALRQAKVRFHPDKVKQAQQVALAARVAEWQARKGRGHAPGAMGLSKVQVEELVKAEEISKILNGWDANAGMTIL